MIAGTAGKGVAGRGEGAGDGTLVVGVFMTGGLAGALGAAVKTSDQPLRVPMVVKTAPGGSGVVSCGADCGDAVGERAATLVGLLRDHGVRRRDRACVWEPTLTSKP